jgi:hypothetical protein
VISHALGDLIQFAEVVSIAHNDLGVGEGAQLEAMVARCYEVLVNRGLVVVGDFEHGADLPGLPKGFVPWKGDGGAIASRVMRAWKGLDHWPNLNDVCWLILTEEGHRVAQIRQRPSDFLDSSYDDSETRY